MKHKYLLIECGREIDIDSHFCFIYVGSSKQAQRDYLTILANSVSCGYYFELYSTEVAKFLLNVMESVSHQITLHSIDARDYCRALKQNVSLPNDEELLRNRHHMLNFLNTNYRISSNLSRRNSSAK